jgi:membrane protease YdiL (CAAX protease family)
MGTVVNGKVPDLLPGTGRRGQFPRGPEVSWQPWRAPVGLFLAFALALLGVALLEIALALAGLHLAAHHTPSGVVLADTYVQDAAFVIGVLFVAGLGGQKVHAWELGLRRTTLRRRWTVSLVAASYIAFLVFSVLWAVALGIHEKEKLLETLGANRNTAQLAGSAVLTCLVAPVCEEVLFRGFFFRALANWRGWLPAALITAIVFGAVHAGSAPAADLVPLGFFGLVLCVLYRYSGSLYLTIAVHALNNALAFGDLEGWSPQGIVGIAAGTLVALAAIRLLAERLGSLGANG